VPFPGENFVAVAMKHINEEPPSLLERRPDVPMRLVAAIDRALAKDPAQRFPSMGAFCTELRACLAELGTPDAERTFIQPSPVLKQGRPHRARAARRRRWPLLLLVALAVAAAIVAVFALRGSNNKGSSSKGPTGGSAIALAGARAFDPGGDLREHDSSARLATDGDPSTYWYTEHYIDGLNKEGVGLVLDAGGAKNVGSITVRSATPGFTAEILAGDSLDSTLKVDSSKQQVGASTTFALHGATARYFVVWITDLGGLHSAEINEVTAKG
jgi:hypothetical protein